MEERNLQFKLNNRSRVDGEIMQVANNTKVWVSIEGIHNHTGADVTLSSDDYTNIDDVDGMDADPSKWWRQLYIDVFYKIPTDAEGVYSTSYGIRSEEIDIA
jgi:hypothetical protein